MDILESVWPADLRADIVSPARILLAQVDGLGKATSGLLTARLVKSTTEDLEQHLLEIHAPSLRDFLGEAVLKATHRVDLPYPVAVRPGELTRRRIARRPNLLAAIARNTVSTAAIRDLAEASDEDELRRHGTLAASAEEFHDQVKRILTSSSVRALIDSVIARINDVPTAASA